MNKFYWVFVCLGVVWAAWGMGVMFEREKCKAVQVENVAARQSQLIKLQEKVNEKTVSSDVDDIRRFLRQKYSIAE